MVFDQQPPTRLQDAGAFLHKAKAVREMVRGDAAGHQVKAAGGKWEIFRIRTAEVHIPRALLADETAGGVQHGGSQVGGDHPPDMRGEFERGVPAAGRHVQRQPVALRVRQFQQAIQILAPGMGWTFDIPLGVLAETGLRLGFHFMMIGHHSLLMNTL
jgi:hypothetical protein